MVRDMAGSPEALMIEQPRSSVWSGAARSRLRWKDTARKIVRNKDKINTLSRINGSMPPVWFGAAISAVRYRLAFRFQPLRLKSRQSDFPLAAT
jgi:hypothetical protein